MERNNAWDAYPGEKKKEVFDFAEEYRVFLSENKTERECVKTFVKAAEKVGFISLKKAIKKNRKLKPGDKGVVRFFDDDIDLYKNSGVLVKSDEVKVDDLNDNLFEFGFYPAP